MDRVLRKCIFCILLFIFPLIGKSQQIYVDLEGKFLHMGGQTEKFDSLVAWPHFKLYQNKPNPAKENTGISFQVNSSGWVSFILYDLLGNPVFSLPDQPIKPGNYFIPVETENFPNGIYIYVFTKDGVSRSMKMIVSR